MPTQAVIDGFKGVVDFYFCMGIPCARKWPVYTKRLPTPYERANQEAFAYGAKLYKTIPEYLKLQFKDMAQGARVSGFDMYMICYMRGYPT